MFLAHLSTCGHLQVLWQALGLLENLCYTLQEHGIACRPCAVDMKATEGSKQYCRADVCALLQRPGK